MRVRVMVRVRVSSGVRGSVWGRGIVRVKIS